MVSRLFGRGKKTSTPQEPQPQVSTPVEPEDEVFTLIGGPNQAQTPKSGHSIYPTLPEYAQHPVASVPNGYGMTGSSASSASHYLDGVPFVLSSQCSLGGEQFDSVVAKIEGLAERVKNINWSAVDYDFNVERSVVQDVAITNTLTRLHAAS